jgi:hypothetical protein
VKVAFPKASRVAWPRTVVPSRNCTVPVGIVVVPAGGATLVAKVTTCPVMVAVGVTVMVTDALCNGGATQIPLRFTCKGTVDALDVMLRVPERVPGAAGVKVRLTVQLAPAASELPHVFVRLNSDDAVTTGKLSEDAPVFVITMDAGEDVPPVACDPNTIWAVERVRGAGVKVAVANTSAVSMTFGAFRLFTVSTRRSLSPAAAVTGTVYDNDTSPLAPPARFNDTGLTMGFTQPAAEAAVN